MLFNRSGFHIFNEYDLSATLEAQTAQLKKEIESDIRSKALSNETEYVEKQIKKHKIMPIEFEPDKLLVSTTEQMIPARFFPQGFFVYDGESYPRQVISFHLPFKGDPMLLRCIPSSRLLWTEEVSFGNEEIIFDMIKFSDSADNLKREKDRVVNYLTQQASNINSQVLQYNSGLENSIKNAITSISEKVSKDSDFLNDLGIPLKEK